MRKIALLSVALALGLVGCKKENTTTTDSAFPTDNLTVDKQQNVFVLDKTGAWCQFCPIGSEQMAMAKGAYGDRIIGIAAHGGSGTDPLKTPAAQLFIDNFLPSQGFPTLFVMNEESGQDIMNDVEAALNPAELPYFGVKHTTAVTDTSINVYAKVECFSTIKNENFFAQSFLLLDGVEGRDYGNGLDLNQTSSLPIVSTGSGSTPTKWVLDAAVYNGETYKKAGDIYTHDEAVVGYDTKTQDWWGVNLAEVNPFGSEFIEGDVLGTKYTPILLSISDDDVMDYSQFSGHASVVTIIWKYKSDGIDTYSYVNGYVSHLN